MKDQVTLAHTEDETKAVASALAKECSKKQSFFVSLDGTLGAGKTTFTRFFIEAYFKEVYEELPQQIPSPTYNIARMYGKTHTIAHLDLYRMSSLQELEAIGYETYFYECSGCICEWLSNIPEGAKLKPSEAIDVSLEIIDEKTRRITIRNS